MTAYQIKTAKKICGTCDVQRDCLITSLIDREPHGVWGGYTSFERRAALDRNINYKACIDDYDDGSFIEPRRRKK